MGVHLPLAYISNIVIVAQDYQNSHHMGSKFQILLTEEINKNPSFPVYAVWIKLCTQNVIVIDGARKCSIFYFCFILW